MSLRTLALKDYLAGYFRQDHLLAKSYALAAGYATKFIRAPRFLSHVSKRPINFCVLITYRCTRACPDCFFLKNLNNKAIPDLDLDRTRELLASPIFKTAIRVGLLGGEPLLNKDVYDIVALLRLKGHIVSVTTNADVLDAAKAKELRRAGLSLLIMSYYQDNHERIREFMLNNGPDGFPAERIAMACHATSIDELRQAHDFARQVGIRTMLPRYTYDFTEKNTLTDADKLAIWREFREFSALAKKEGRVGLSPLEPYSFYGHGRQYCQNALMTYIVAPDFEISPCCQPVAPAYGDIHDYRASEKFKANVFYPGRLPAMCRRCPVLGGGNFL